MSGAGARVARLASGLGRLAGAFGVGLMAERALMAALRGSDSEGPVSPLPADVSRRMLPTPDGGSVHVIERGSGRPLVFLHGITFQASAWAHQFDLSDQFRVIACDLRGHGDSAPGSDGFGLDVLASDLATLLAGLDLHDAILVGHSMGGMTVQTFCRQYPEVLEARVAGLVLLSTSARRVMLADDQAGALARQLAERGDKKNWAPFPLLRLPWSDLVEAATRFVFGRSPNRVDVARAWAMYDAMDDEYLGRSSIGLLTYDVREALLDIDVPTLVVTGELDRLTPPPFAREMAGLLPRSELHLLPGAGHQIMFERPGELDGLIRSFAAGLDGERASERDLSGP
ncbi:MAG: alpha/beta hydrolase [Actinomycetia bacterium]|nr:alpha/beta hydrolase [Actinomycetes bacterium]